MIAGNSISTGSDILRASASYRGAAHNVIGNGINSGLTDGVDGNRLGTQAAPINPLLGPLRNIPYSLATAEYIANTPGLGTSVLYPELVLNLRDPETNPNDTGFLGGGRPFGLDNLTAQGTINGDDDHFVVAGRTQLHIVDSDLYTFGFSSDDGAQLRVKNAVFRDSTRLATSNPANPAHRYDTLILPGNTGNSQTLGVTRLEPGTYEIEFLMWEFAGGAFGEVIVARGEHTRVDEGFRLLSPGIFLEPVTVTLNKITDTEAELRWTPNQGLPQSAPTPVGPWSLLEGVQNGGVVTLMDDRKFFRVAQ